jgi:hypothetical protein
MGVQGGRGMLIEYRGGRGLTGIERGVDCLRGTRQGHASDCAENGVEAVGACASQRYDLILMVSRAGWGRVEQGGAQDGGARGNTLVRPSPDLVRSDLASPRRQIW